MRLLSQQFYAMHPIAGKTIHRIVFWPGSYFDTAPAVVTTHYFTAVHHDR
jgi:hypothetical protein